MSILLFGNKAPLERRLAAPQLSGCCQRPTETTRSCPGRDVSPDTRTKVIPSPGWTVKREAAIGPLGAHDVVRQLYEFLATREWIRSNPGRRQHRCTVVRTIRVRILRAVIGVTEYYGIPGLLP